MSFIPLKEGDWRALNIILEGVWNSIGNGSTTSSTVTTATTNPVIAKTVEIVGSEVTTTVPVTKEVTDENAPTTPMPSMVGYTPLVTALSRSTSLQIDWSGWSGYGQDDIVDYDIYGSTETTCTISDANKIVSHVRNSPYILTGLTAGTTYSIRIRANGSDASQTASENVSIAIKADLAVYMDANDPTVPGDIKIVGGTVLEINDADATTGWTIFDTVYFTSGGTHEVIATDTLTGHTSTKTFVVDAVVLTDGTWAGGNATGYFIVSSYESGFITGETLDQGANINVATLTNQRSSATTIYSSESTLYEGSGSIYGIVPPSTACTFLWTGGAVDISGTGYKYLKAYLKPNYSAASFYSHVLFGETNFYEQVSTKISIAGNSWQLLSYDISAIADASRNAVTKIGFCVRNAGALPYSYYIDYIYADPGPSAVKAYDGDRVITLYPHCYSSSYLGNGTSQTITIPRKGTPARISIEHMTVRGVLWITGMAAGHCKLFPDETNSSGDLTTGITAVADCSFSLGNSAAVNTNNETYYYTVWWND